MSTLAVSRTLISMDTENTRITRKEAALLAGVSVRTISRWTAEGVLPARYTGKRAVPVDYDPAEVLRAAGKSGESAETDIAT